MDEIEQKKWFVYLGDHHEGPFTVGEIKEKMTHGQVNQQSYVWGEGMADWQVMSDVAVFKEVLNGNVHHNLSETPALETPALVTPVLEAPVIAVQNGASAEGRTLTTEIESTGGLLLTPGVTTEKVELENLQKPKEPTKPVKKYDFDAAPAGSINRNNSHVHWHEQKVEKRGSGILKYLIFLLLIGIGAGLYTTGRLDPYLNSPGVRAATEMVMDLTKPYLMKAVDKFPMLGRWISPIPKLDDITPAEMMELRSAALESLNSNGPALAIALSQSDLNNPSFYLTSNAPDGTNFEIYVEGIPDTLLNQRSFSAKLAVTLQKKFGKTGPLRFQSAQSIPKGQYMIYATEALDQPPEIHQALMGFPDQKAKTMVRPAKMLATRKYFLGGKLDSVYSERLKEYHDKLRDSAKRELDEIRQFEMTLESQLNSTVTKFNGIRKAKMNGNQKKKTWNDFHSHWSQLENSLDATFQKWNPTTLENEYFYGSLYQMTQQVGLTVEKVHAYQDNYFKGAVDPKALEIQLGETLNAAQTSVNALKSKLDQAQKLAPTPNGMPRRDGI